MSTSPSMGLVIGMGLGTVFIGLVCIIVICYIMGAVIKLFESRKPIADDSAESKESDLAAPVDEPKNKGELIAAISCAIAEELGENVEAIRIKSIRRVN